MAVIDHIDPDARRIYLLAGVTEYHPVADIYTECRALRRTNEVLRKYDNFVSGGGNLPKNLAGTSRTPRFAIFNNCKVVVSGDTYVSGEQLFADAAGDLVGSGKDCVDRALSPVDAYLDYAPPEAEVIIVQTAGGLNATQDTYLTRIHTLLDSIEGGLDHQEVMRILLAGMAGKVSGAEANTPVFRDISDTLDRITAITDANGNRTSVTLDAS